MKTLGLDLGTTSLSCVVVEEGGCLCYRKTVPNRCQLPGRPYWQDASALCARAKSLICGALSAHPDVAAIGLTGQMHGIVYTDGAGRPVSPLFTWQDDQADEPYADGLTYGGALSQMTGYRAAPGYGMTTHFVLQKKAHKAAGDLVSGGDGARFCGTDPSLGGLPKNAVTFCTIADCVGLSITGAYFPVMHASNAASLGLYDVTAGGFDLAALEKAGLFLKPLKKGVPPASVSLLPGRLLLPQVTAQPEVIGYFNGNIPVYCALGDNQASFYGAVKDPENEVLVNIGTGSQVSCCRAVVCTLPGVETRPYVGGRYLWVGCGLCGGKAYAMLERFFEAVLGMAGGNYSSKEASLYEAMERAAQEVFPADALPGYAFSTARVTVEPTFCGTREDRSKTGTISGLTESNFTPGHLVNGFLSGMVDELAPAYEAFCRSGSFHTAVVSGNGARKNAYLRALIGRRLSLPIRLSPYEEEVACGAALYARHSSE